MGWGGETSVHSVRFRNEQISLPDARQRMRPYALPSVAAQVLVIEDDPDIRDSVIGLLESEVPWIEVSSAGDGMEALELLESGTEPCLALLDVMMPVMNGFEFLDALRDRELAQGMRVVLISGYVQFARHVNYPGITGLLPKPFRAADLLTIVRQHCPESALRPGAELTGRVGEDPDGEKGDCLSVNSWHIDQGTIDGVDVAGLTIAGVNNIPGNRA